MRHKYAIALRTATLGFVALASSVLFGQDINNPASFIPITPCRAVDTRYPNGPTGPITGVAVDLTITGAAYAGVPAAANPCTAITGAPTGAHAVAVNLTMVNVAGPADLRIAQGGTPPTSSVMNSSGAPLANATVVPVNAAGQLAVKSGGASFNLIIDIFGYYFDDAIRSGDYFRFFTNSSAYALLASNASTTCTGNCGIMLGALTGNGTGITSFLPDTGAGTNTGVRGVVGTIGDNSAGTAGYSLGTSGKGYGAAGISLSPSFESAGVYGIESSGFVPTTDTVHYFAAGVRGESSSRAGVLGLSTYVGVSGVAVGADGHPLAHGVLGMHAAVDTAVYAYGDFRATGGKFFVEPHPTDASRQIQYVSLEGPEAGTYFRGQARIVNGFATIPVPESFRLVSDSQGLTAVVSPVGEMAVLAVVSQDLTKIVVQGSRNVAFNYFVNGIRKALKDVQPIVANSDFVPDGPNDNHFFMYPADARTRLVATHIYNADGTVNMDTARQMGWAARWEQRDADARARAEATSRSITAGQEAEKASPAKQPGH